VGGDDAESDCVAWEQEGGVEEAKSAFRNDDILSGAATTAIG
jgi:hypothetical protein